MSDRILFNENFGDLEWTGNISKKAILPISALTIPEPILSYDHYYYDLDGEIYNCTSITRTSRYLTFLYSIGGTNALYVRLEKQNNYVTITILPEYFPDVNFNTSVLKLFEKDTPSGEYKDMALVRFNRWLAVKVLKYDATYTYQVVKDGDIPDSETKTKKYAIVRFTKDSAVEIIYDEETESIELVEV